MTVGGAGRWTYHGYQPVLEILVVFLRSLPRRPPVRMVARTEHVPLFLEPWLVVPPKILHGHIAPFEVLVEHLGDRGTLASSFYSHGQGCKDMWRDSVVLTERLEDYVFGLALELHGLVASRPSKT